MTHANLICYSQSKVIESLVEKWIMRFSVKAARK